MGFDEQITSKSHQKSHKKVNFQIMSGQNVQKLFPIGMNSYGSLFYSSDLSTQFQVVFFKIYPLHY